MVERNADPATDEPPDEETSIQASQHQPDRRRALLSGLLFVAVVVFAVIAVRDNWAEVQGSLENIGPLDIASSGAAAIASLICSWIVWRLVLESLGGSIGRRPSATIYFTGQVGKYVPGSIWPLVIQAQMGAAHGVGRSVMVASYGVTLIVTVAAAGVLSPLLLLAGVDPIRLAAVGGGLVLAVVAALAIVHPRGIDGLRATISRRTGRTLPAVHLEGTVALRATAGACVAWVLFGVHTLALAAPLGASLGDLAAITAAFAVAFVAGLLVIPLPAGAGVRDAVLVVALEPVLDRPSALVVALGSRFVILLAELGLAAVAGVPSAVRSTENAVRRRSGRNAG